jgi:hypothetical protein
MKSIHFLGFSEKLPKDYFFSFYQWNEEREISFHFISQHSNGAKGLLWIVVLTTDEKTYM